MIWLQPPPGTEDTVSIREKVKVSPSEKWRILKNVTVLSCAFMVQFTAFQVRHPPSTESTAIRHAMYDSSISKCKQRIVNISRMWKFHKITKKKMREKTTCAIRVRKSSISFTFHTFAQTKWNWRRDNFNDQAHCLRLSWDGWQSSVLFLLKKLIRFCWFNATTLIPVPWFASAVRRSVHFLFTRSFHFAKFHSTFV